MSIFQLVTDYKPEAYIEKDIAINEEIDRLCLNAMRSLQRRDVMTDSIRALMDESDHRTFQAFGQAKISSLTILLKIISE